MKTLNLDAFHIQRPEKVTWRANIQHRDILGSLKSKSLRQFLSDAEQLLQENNIEVELKTLSKEDFLVWLEYYKEKMSENGFDIIASPEWYDSRKEQGKEVVGMFFKKNTEDFQGWVATGIFAYEGKHKTTFSFKASDRIKMGHGEKGTLGALLDYYFLKEMTEQNFEIISAGKSRNAFGVYNTLGYLNYSLRFGFVPRPSEKDGVLSSVPLTDEGVVLFYGIREGKFILFAAKPQSSTQKFEHAGFAAPELPFEEIEYTEDQVTEVLDQ